MIGTRRPAGYLQVMPTRVTAATRLYSRFLRNLSAACLAAVACWGPASAAAQDSEESGGLSLGDLLEIGQGLWEDHAPPELQEEYRLPTIEEVESFLADIEEDLADGNVQRLAAYAPEAKLALHALRHFEGGAPLADWLAPRIDFLVAAEEIQETSPQPAPPPPKEPRAPAAPPKIAPAPQFTQEYWNEAVAGRARPKQADRYLPVFKKAFSSKGVPPELAWLSEVESSLNLNARSPVGAYGPFQFMPATAERFGLRVGSPDDRAHPRKSAEAAASYLGILYKQFQSWPLALAAYNAGEGRVGRALKAAGVTTFEELSPHLPAETRMYVPKVLATIGARESIDPTSLPALQADRDPPSERSRAVAAVSPGGL